MTSPDGSRTWTYEVVLRRSSCLQGLGQDRLSRVSFAGGSVAELESCARGLGVSALYYEVSHDAGESWVGLFPGAPEFLNQAFRARFSRGLAPGTELVVKRDLSTQPAAASVRTDQ